MNRERFEELWNTKERVDQLKIELWTLLHIIEMQVGVPKNILEIGTKSGGTLRYWKEIVDTEGMVIAIDIDNIPKKYEYLSGLLEDKRLNFILGDSKAPEIISKAKSMLGDKKLDILFIDGDHKYEAAKSDFLNYVGLVKKGGIIVFHDVSGCSSAKKYWDDVLEEYLMASNHSSHKDKSKQNIKDKIFTGYYCLCGDKGDAGIGILIK